MARGSKCGRLCVVIMMLAFGIPFSRRSELRGNTILLRDFFLPLPFGRGSGEVLGEPLRGLRLSLAKKLLLFNLAHKDRAVNRADPLTALIPNPSPKREKEVWN